MVRIRIISLVPCIDEASLRRIFCRAWAWSCKSNERSALLCEKRPRSSEKSHQSTGEQGRLEGGDHWGRWDWYEIPVLCWFVLRWKSFCTSSAVVRATEMSSIAKSCRGAGGSSGWSLSLRLTSMSSTIFSFSEWRRCTRGTRAYSKSRWVSRSQEEAENDTNVDSHSSGPGLCVHRRFWNTLDQKPSSPTRFLPRLQAIWSARETLSASDTAANTSLTFISAERRFSLSPSRLWQALSGADKTLIIIFSWNSLKVNTKVVLPAYLNSPLRPACV